MKNTDNFELLLSLPPNMCRNLAKCAPEVAQRAFASFDPPTQQLGSGGGTSYLLEQAWKDSNSESFSEWLTRSKKIVIHGGGESRRLPAYAPSGKLFMPLPVFRWSTGQRVDQTLLDLTEPTLKKIAQATSENAKLLIASGDVLLHLEEEIPHIPDADVVFLGLWVKPEEATNFGVLFCDRHQPEKLLRFLQKPTLDTIRQKSKEALFLIDVGIWILSKRAINCLLEKTGWEAQSESFKNTIPSSYDLYGKWALSLGSDPVEKDHKITTLSTAVVPLSQAKFFHFGTNIDMIQSMYALQNLEQDQRKLGHVSTLAQPRQFTQNTLFNASLQRDANHSIWVENSYIPEGWELSHEHILTGIIENDWNLKLESGVCLDMVPIDEVFALRVYGYKDTFRGFLKDEKTEWLGAPALDWFKKRGLDFATSGISPETDIQQAALFPLLDKFDSDFVTWMFSTQPNNSEKWRTLWKNSDRLSARELAQQAHLPRIYEQRNHLCQTVLPLMAENAEHSVFYKLDLEATAKLYANSSLSLPPSLDAKNIRNPLITLHDQMFRASVCQHRKDSKAKEYEKAAFNVLRDVIVTPFKRTPVYPHYTLLNDQIVWGRCPVRLDFAGGWTDTPPYCLEHGGSVLNAAVELNGQPPIQVFARKTASFELIIRSIDLGKMERLKTYEEVRAYDQIGSEFSIARAAFALTGFHPDFNGSAFKTLKQQLEQLGGGIEISMLAAVPKGSGLGTSSMLAATLLGVLSNLIDLNWDHNEIIQRTLALEQMLTSGGGWQDQVGGILPGIKFVQTVPGLNQSPVSRWLPEALFKGERKARMLLYYTGLTRVARNILGEIVRGMFLNSAQRLLILKQINQNAQKCFDALQRNDFETFAQGIQQSWKLNQTLDPGTNPPAVKQILSKIENKTSAVKLLGAGGGGYLFIIAKSSQAAIQIQEQLEKDPPNQGARFVNFDLSKNGLQITRS